jgi:hypothetical protein
LGSKVGDTSDVTTENAMFLLTREVKSKGASRLINVNVRMTEQPMMLPFVSYRTVQASGTGVGNRRASDMQMQ